MVSGETNKKSNEIIAKANELSALASGLSKNAEDARDTSLVMHWNKCKGKLVRIETCVTELRSIMG